MERMIHAPEMPELTHDQRTLLMHSVRHQLPAGHLVKAEQSRRDGRFRSLQLHQGALTDDQPALSGSLCVVLHLRRARYEASVARHGRHDEAVPQMEGTHLERLEQSRELEGGIWYTVTNEGRGGGQTQHKKDSA